MSDSDPITRLNAALEGRYRIERELGEGGMATVYLADDIKHERKVALDLHEELQGTGVLVNSLHPATYMPTGMVRRAGVTPRATIGEGADAVMQLIVSDEIEGGQFFNQLVPRRANAQAYDMESRRRLRELSRELTGSREEYR